jgi:hypothetical protein
MVMMSRDGRRWCVCLSGLVGWLVGFMLAAMALGLSCRMFIELPRGV